MAIYRLKLENINFNNNLTCNKVRYEIFDSSDLTPESLIKSIDRVDSNRYVLEVDLDFNNKDLLYCVSTLYFTNGKHYTLPYPTVITKDGNDFTHNDSVILTPKITIDDDLTKTRLGNFTIYSSDFVLLTGNGSHKYTSWKITDSKGKIYINKEKDYKNLTSLRVPDNSLDPNKLYIVEVVYISSNGDMSNKGKLLFKTTTNNDLDFDSLYDLDKYRLRLEYNKLLTEKVCEIFQK